MRRGVFAALLLASLVPVLVTLASLGAQQDQATGAAVANAVALEQRRQLEREVKSALASALRDDPPNPEEVRRGEYGLRLLQWSVGVGQTFAREGIAFDAWCGSYSGPLDPSAWAQGLYASSGVLRPSGLRAYLFSDPSPVNASQLACGDVVRNQSGLIYISRSAEGVLDSALPTGVFVTARTDRWSTVLSALEGFGR